MNDVCGNPASNGFITVSDDDDGMTYDFDEFVRDDKDWGF